MQDLFTRLQPSLPSLLLEPEVEFVRGSKEAGTASEWVPRAQLSALRLLRELTKTMTSKQVRAGGRLLLLVLFFSCSPSVLLVPLFRLCLLFYFVWFSLALRRSFHQCVLVLCLVFQALSRQRATPVAVLCRVQREF